MTGYQTVPYIIPSGHSVSLIPIWPWHHMSLSSMLGYKHLLSLKAFNSRIHQNNVVECLHCRKQMTNCIPLFIELCLTCNSTSLFVRRRRHVQSNSETGGGQKHHEYCRHQHMFGVWNPQVFYSYLFIQIAAEIMEQYRSWEHKKKKSFGGEKRSLQSQL